MTDAKPVSDLVPRLLSREMAARYVGLSPNTFDKEVRAGTFPRSVALRASTRKLWDRVALDRALDSSLTGGQEDRNVRKAHWHNRENRKADAR